MHQGLIYLLTAHIDRCFYIVVFTFTKINKYTRFRYLSQKLSKMKLLLFIRNNVNRVYQTATKYYKTTLILSSAATLGVFMFNNELQPYCQYDRSQSHSESDSLSVYSQSHSQTQFFNFMHTLISKQTASCSSNTPSPRAKYNFIADTVDVAAPATVYIEIKEK